MSTAAEVQGRHDYTELTHVLRRAVVLGAIEAMLVLAFSLVSRFLDGTVELVLRGAIVFVGLAVVSVLPGLWTRARSIEGIAGAAGVGLGATVVFLILDVSILQPSGTYTNRWLEIGGGSNWWYHPVWWMAGTFLPWMGAWALARQGERVSPVGVIVTAFVFTAIVGSLASVLGFPGAAWGVGTFAVAYLPAIVLTVVVSGRGGSGA